jgi:hypothetical protein
MKQVDKFHRERESTELGLTSKNYASNVIKEMERVIEIVHWHMSNNRKREQLLQSRQRTSMDEPLQKVLL